MYLMTSYMYILKKYFICWKQSVICKFLFQMTGSLRDCIMFSLFNWVLLNSRYETQCWVNKFYLVWAWESNSCVVNSFIKINISQHLFRIQSIAFLLLLVWCSHFFYNNLHCLSCYSTVHVHLHCTPIIIALSYQ